MEYYSPIKRMKLPFAATWMDPERITLYEVRKDKYQVLSLTWDLKCETNELIYKTETDSQS